MGRMKRAVGYCLNFPCREFAKGAFLLNHGDASYKCSFCRVSGIQEPEACDYPKERPVKQARVEFDFCPLDRRYKAVAIVNDDSLVDGAVACLRSPLIKTEKRALKVAEAILCNLQRSERTGWNEPETLLSFDTSRQEFEFSLHQWAQGLEGSFLAEHSGQRQSSP